ncbi:MAG: hypothetical protein ACLP8S_11410 [Solirubrobacteraceae bacterium]
MVVVPVERELQGVVQVHERLVATHPDRPANAPASNQASVELVHHFGHDRTVAAGPDGPAPG